MTLAILSIDPGKKTGVVWLALPDDKPAVIQGAWEIDGTPPMIIAAFNDWLLTTDTYANRLLIIEDWEYRHGVATDARWACEPIGGLKYLAWHADIAVRMQMPAVRTTIPNSRKALDPIGYWLPGGEGHARQALRHALAYVCFTRHHLPTLEKIKPRP